MRIYLAGPDVFRPDAAAYGRWLKAQCARHGLQGVFPFDTDEEAGAGRQGMDAAQAICRANLALIDEVDAVMANLEPFRGQEPDSGTVFEIGYAHARGKPVWVYTPHASPLAERVAAGADGHGPVDARGWRVEDFGLPLNLMIACTATVVAGDADECLRRIATHVRGGGAP
ncbi:nucleoside 2-deoxyribosyltransferase [Pigmentiphaga soli]|uniref:Nucleoside 2-deoxyribosyltransferase n=1 Tax=Pigmentiphaga soli TaxID=1007095 RepID=A0ABP8GJA7_9BURK